MLRINGTSISGNVACKGNFTFDSIIPYAEKSLSFLQQQMLPRSPYNTVDLSPPLEQLGFAGNLSISWGINEENFNFCPIQITAPQFWPLVAGLNATFNGSVATPFRTMGEVPPGVPPIAYFIRGYCDSVEIFEIPVPSNGFFEHTEFAIPAGDWEFQLITYDGVTEKPVGESWRSVDHAGTMSQYLLEALPSPTTRFSNVIIDYGDGGIFYGADIDLSDIADKTNLKCYITIRTDVDYVKGLLDIDTVLGKVIAPEAPYITFPSTGDLKFRLVRMSGNCMVEDLGRIWNRALSGVGLNQGLQLEIRNMVNSIPFVATRTQSVPATGPITVPVTAGEFLELRIVDANTERVLGGTYMDSGLIRSYNVPPNKAGQSTSNQTVFYDDFNYNSFIYDQAIAAIAFLQAGDWEYANRAILGLVNAQISTGPNTGGWEFSVDQKVPEQTSIGYIRNGACAWVIYALLISQRPEYASNITVPGITTAINTGLAYLDTYKNGINLINGGRGLYDDVGFDPDYIVPWWSTEHNIDVWFCFALAADLYNNSAYQTRANEIKAGMMTYGVDTTNNIFWQGGIGTTPDGAHALDTHSWGAALLYAWGETLMVDSSLIRAKNLYVVNAKGITGYTVYVPTDGAAPGTIESPWFEGSFGVARSYFLIGNDSEGLSIYSRLVPGQIEDGSYPYSVIPDPVNGINSWPSVCGVAWSIISSTPTSPVWDASPLP